MTQKIYFNLETIDYDKICQLHEKIFLEKEKGKATNKRKKVEKKDMKLLEKKYSFFIHNLISRQLSSDENKDIAYLRAEWLRDIFGRDYTIMINILKMDGIIKLEKEYIEGEQCNGYKIENLKEKVRFSYKPYYYPYKPFIDRLEKNIEEWQKNAIKSIEKSLTPKVYEKYIKSLNKLKFNQKKAQEYIDIHFKEDSYSKAYHLMIKDWYKEKNFQIKESKKKDNKDKRIYHILTSTPRELKYFLNIKYIVDIHNSHPILFNSIIYDKYNIHKNKRYDISNKIIEINKIINKYNYNIYNNSIYKSGCHVNNSLNNKEMNFILPPDVLKYIYLTSTGQFWDKILEDDYGKVGNYDLTRQDIKQLMFAYVFYSKEYPNKRKFARLFEKQFPNVFRLVESFKDGIKKEKDRTVLSAKLRTLESRLFRKALKILFKRGYEVVSLHDAIVVLDTKANEKCTQEEVKSVLESVFRNEGLVCDCSVDIYGEKVMEDFLASERELRQKGEEYILSIRDKEEFKELIKDYDEGKSEIIWTKDKKGVMLHPKDIKSLMYKECS